MIKVFGRSSPLNIRFWSVICLLIFFTGCSASSVSEKQAYKVVENTEAADATKLIGQQQKELDFENVRKLIQSSTVEEAVHDPWGLMYFDKSIKPYLFIRPKNENDFYLAADKLYSAFIGSLNWAVECERSKQSFEYDYVLRTNYSTEIYFDSKTNIFHFENDKKFYRLWGDKTNLWDEIKFYKDKASADFSSDRLILEEAERKEDLNNDKIMETISLRTVVNITETFNSPSLYLAINDNVRLVLPEASEGIRIKPETHILEAADKKSKAIIINSAMKPADWLPEEEYFTFTFNDSQIVPVTVIKPQVKFTVKGNKVLTEYPDFKSKFNFTVKAENLKFYGDARSIFSTENNPVHLRGLSFEKSKAGIDRFVTFENAELHKGGYFYTVKTEYEYVIDKLVPTAVNFVDRKI